MAIETDVLIVGSGPAGSVAAKYAAERGVRVTMIEMRDAVGTPVRCGELMPSVDEITEMFPKLSDAESLFNVPASFRCRDVDSIMLVDPKGRERQFPFTGYTTDRDRFDQYHADAAVRAGAELMTGCRFKGAYNGTARTSQGEISYKVIIGADGPNSLVARSLGLPSNKNCYPAVTAQAEGDFDPTIQMFFGRIAPGAYGWIIPKNGVANVGIGFSPKFSNGSLREYMDRFVEMHGLKLITPLKGKYVPSEGPVRNTVSGNCLLAGDAAGVVMPVNGGGIPQAMITGRMAGIAAAENVLNGAPLSSYEGEWRNVLYKPLRIAASNKKLADTFAFRSDRSTALCMSILGTRRMSKLIRCKHLFP